MKKYIKSFKLFEDTKKNNLEGTLITQDDIIDTIKNGGTITASVVKDNKLHKPDDIIKPISIDDDGLIVVEIDNDEYYVDLDDVREINF